MYKKIFLIYFILLFIAVFTSLVFANNEATTENKKMVKGHDTVIIESWLGIGLINGILGEYVYDNGRTISRLDWNIDALGYVTYGACARYALLFAGLSARTGFGDSIGTMDDSDWLDNNPALKTNYSHHDNYLEHYYYYDVFIGMFIDIAGVYVKPKIGFLYQSVKMSARDGYLEYPPGSPKKPVYGVGIIYQQRYYIPYIALEGQFDVYNDWSLIAGVTIGVFAEANDTDNHVKRELDFYDDFNTLLYFKLTSGVMYVFNENIAITAKCMYEYVPEQKGDMYYIDTATGVKSPTYSDAAGISMSLLSFECSVTFKIYL